MTAVWSSSGVHGRGAVPKRNRTSSDSPPSTNLWRHSMGASLSANSGSTNSTSAPQCSTM